VQRRFPFVWHSEQSTATMQAVKVPIYDYGTLDNALFMGNNPPPTPGWASFTVVWQGGTASTPVSSTDPTKGIFSGTFASSNGVASSSG
jgi:hypothetical protein